MREVDRKNPGGGAGRLQVMAIVVLLLILAASCHR